MKKIRVLIVDDSALVRAILTEIINAQPDMMVAGAAPDPIVAREMIRQSDPDVLTLDVEMPRMDGLDFLEKLMRLRPMPVVMVSTLTERGSEVTLRALELGAVDFVSKPKIGISEGLREYAEEITGKIRDAAQVRVKRIAPATPTVPTGASKPLANRIASTERLLLIGASTGGTEAIKVVLQQMPPDAPGILVTQHMPEAYTKAFAARLDSLCRIRVSEAGHGERILPGHAFISPGHSHLKVKKSGANYITELSQAPPVNRHRPAVDVLFQSAAQCVGRNAFGIILTGMGKDGAVGMRDMHDAGAHTVAQDEASCVVFGMPGAAIAQGGVDEVLPLQAISHHVLKRLAASGGTGNRV